MLVKVIGAVITLPLLFILPGYVLSRGRLFSSLKMSWTGRALLVLALSVSIASLVALLLAEVGYFKIWLLDLVLILISASARLLFGNTGRPLFLRGPGGKEVILLAVLCLLSIVIFFHPAEYVVGDGDPGYYFNLGYQLSETGSMSVYEDSIPAMTDAELRIFFRKSVKPFSLFKLVDRDTGKLQPLLYDLLPVWIGIFITLFGTWGGLYVVPLFALLAIFAIYALGRRFGGPGGAWAGALLAILFFPMVWFSRAPVSEIFCQFFILSAIFFFAEFLDTRGSLVGLASALAITAAATARPEAILVFGPLLAVMAVRLFYHRYRTGDYVFANAIIAGLGYVFFYIVFAEYEYIKTNAGKVLGLFGRSAEAGMDVFVLVIPAFIIGMLLVVNLWPVHRYLRRFGRWLSGPLREHADQVSRSMKTAFALATLATFTYFYFIAPGRAARISSPQKFFFYSAYFFGGILVFAFIAGLCLLIYKVDRVGLSFVIAVVVSVFTLAFTESSVTTGFLPWLTRRYMTVVVPMLFVGFGYLLGRLWNSKQMAAGLRTVVVLSFAGFVAIFCFFGAPIFGHVEYQGVDSQLSDIATSVGDDVVVFTGYFAGEAFGLPLRLQHHVDARIACNLDNAKGFVEMVRKYEKQGRKVLIEFSGLDAVNCDAELFDLLSLEKELEAEVSFPRLSTAVTVRPRNIGMETHQLTFFRLETKPALGATQQ